MLYQSSESTQFLVYVIVTLTYGLVMPYGDIDLGQY